MNHPIPMKTIVDVPERVAYQTGLVLVVDTQGNIATQIEAITGPYKPDRAMVIGVNMDFEGNFTYTLQSVYDRSVYTWSFDYAKRKDTGNTESDCNQNIRGEGA